MNKINSYFSCALVVVWFLVSSQSLLAQTNSAEQTWTVNFKETDIQEVIRFVSKTTDKTIIVDPKVKGKVQVISAKPVNSKELYDLFLSILEVQGFAAVESGDVIRIIPAKDARTAPVPVKTDMPRDANSEIITQVIQLENISAAKLIPVLRPLAPQQAHMAAYAPSNAIIISDTAANIERISKVIESIDLSAVEKTDIIALEHASAEEVVRMLGQLQKTQTQKGQADTKQVVLVSDQRTNSVLITGDEMERQRLKTLINYLDTPLTQSGNVKVVYLEYAQAKDLSGVLSKVVQNMERMSQKGAVSGAQTNTATIEADEGTNSLIVTAEADVMQSLLSVVERLDIRRAQVLVEAIIVEVNDLGDDSLGIQWLFQDETGSYGSSTANSVNGTIGGAALDAIQELDSGSGETSALGTLVGSLSSTPGQVLGFGRVDDSFSFNVVINALKTNDDANILSTPTLLTLDNEEASIVVGQDVPFVTGSFSSTGNDSNPNNPFQTINRENVGISLKVTPQINEGDALVLEIEQEVSDLTGAASDFNASDVITNQRSIKTKVLAENGQTIVLGGLMKDSVRQTVSKVPLLGDIPWIGRLFRNDSTNVEKNNLLVFIRPTIVRDGKTLSGATAEKYKYIREKQLERFGIELDSVADSQLPLLPEWEAQLKKLDSIKATESVDAVE